MTYAVLSKVGNRENNEDAVAVMKHGESWCFALADGLGGHKNGEVASKIAVNTAVSEFCQAEVWNLQKQFQSAQKKVIEKQIEMNAAEQMKTTLVVLSLKQRNRGKPIKKGITNNPFTNQ